MSVKAPLDLRYCLHQQWTSRLYITGWVKDLSLLYDFTFMHIYKYLINSQEKEFDRKSLKAFKSLKAYKYFVDGLVTNVFVPELDPEFPAKQDDKEQVQLLFPLKSQNHV